MRISPFTSLFLDALRLFAALGVVFSHLHGSHLAPSADALKPYGHFFVIMFFVLSGYVIAATTDAKRSDAVRYFSVRLARLWTVAIPSLLVAFLLEKIGPAVAPGFFAEFDRGYSFLRQVLAVTFTNELWFISAGPPMNLVVWSLAYEFWYYVIFGIAVFVRQPMWRLWGLIAVCAIVGPKILVLFPAWLMGAAIWWLKDEGRPGEHRGWWIGGLSIGLILAMVIVHPHWPGEIGGPPWFFSGSWLSDTCFGIGVAGLIWSCDRQFQKSRVSHGLEVVIRRGAGVSFSLYLLHFPLMTFLAGVLPYDRTNPVQVGGILAFVFLIVYAFGSVFEPLRKPWALRFERTIRSLLPTAPQWPNVTRAVPLETIPKRERRSI